MIIQDRGHAAGEPISSAAEASSDASGCMDQFCQQSQALFDRLDELDTSDLRSLMRAADLDDMDGADLRGADLQHQDLSHISFRGADFTDADLSRCDFSYCDLSYAILRHADLTGANLGCAQLHGADFTGARRRGTNFKCADLDAAVGFPPSMASIACAGAIGVLGLYAATRAVRHWNRQRDEVEAGQIDAAADEQLDNPVMIVTAQAT